MSGSKPAEDLKKKASADLKKKASAELKKKASADLEGKGDVVLGELGEIRRALSEIEKLRFSKGVSNEEYTRLEYASVDLRDREREVIAKLGVEIASKIKASSLSLSELSKRIKARTAKLSKLPKSMDKISAVILEIIDIARRVEREL